MNDSGGMVSVVDARGVSRVFDDGTAALDGVTFSVAARELVAVVGPSGCGKSTLMRLAAGLDQPTTGSVEVTTDRVASVFQDPTLLPWRTLIANVELPGELDGLGRDERRDRARRAINAVGLAGFERHLPHQLSGGMQMRASFARALTTDPDLFLFDEPFASVDEIARQHLGEMCLDLFQEIGFAGIFVSHSISEALFLAGRVLVLSPRPGRIVAEFDVPFPYPRQPTLRFDPAFAELSGAVFAALAVHPR